MKLHLPKGLRKAVMACMAALTTLTTTVGTGIITGGAVTYMLAAVPQAEASYVWNGGMGNKTADDWKTEGNWTADGSTWNATGTGPGTTDSNMWDEIVLTGNGSADSLVFGAEDSRVVLEGWNPKFNLGGGATLYAQYKKLQGGDKWIKVNNNSVLDAMLGGTGNDGNEGGTITVDVGAGSDFTLRLAKNMGGDGIMIHLNDATATAAIVSGDGNAHSMSKLTLGSVLANSGGELATHKLNFTLGDNISPSSIAYVFADLEASDEEITAENAAAHAGEYWVSDDYTVYYVHSTEPYVVSENRNIAWNQTGTRGYTVEAGVTLSINNGSGGAGSAVAGQSYGYGDIELEGAGSTLVLHMAGGAAASIKTVSETDKYIVDSAISLGEGSKISIEDGSYYFSRPITVLGSAQIETTWSKGTVFSTINGNDADAILTVRGPANEWYENSFSFNGAGEFNGTVQLQKGPGNATTFFILNHAQALQNAKIDVGAEGDKLILALNVAESTVRALTGNAKIALVPETIDGQTVGKNVGVTAAELTITAASGDFGGKLTSDITLNITGGTQGITGGSYDGYVKVGADGTLNVSGSITLAHAVENAGKVDVSGVTGLVLGSAITDAGVTTDKVTTYTIINGGTVTGLEAKDSDTLKGAIVSDALKQLGTEWSFANGVLTITKTAEDLTWSGGALALADGSTLDDAGVYDPGDNITFKTADAVVSLGSEIDVPELTVESDIKVEVDGAYKVTVGALTTEGEFSIGGTGHSLGAVTGGGVLTVAPGVAATLGEVIGDAATLDCATVKITGEGTELAADSRLNTRAVVIDGATVQSADAYFAGDVTLDNGGVLVASGQTELFNWGVNQKISVLNGAELQLGTVRMTLEGDDVMNLKDGKVTGTGDGDALLDMCQNTNIINSEGSSAVEGTLRVTNNNTAVFNVTEGTLTINELKGRDGQEAFTKNGDGELLVKALTNLGGMVTVNAGTYTIAAAEYTLDTAKLTVAEGATLKLATTGATSCEGTLTVGGNLTLDCALAITGTLTTTGETAYTDGADGYVVADMVLAAATGTLTLGEAAAITYNGEAVTDYTVADNSVVAALTDKTVYYVNSAAYEYSATKIDAGATISIAETGELVIKTTGNSIAAIEMAEGAKVVIANESETSLNDIFGSAIELSGTVVFKGSEVVNINSSDNSNLNNADLVIDGGQVVLDIPGAGHADLTGDITVTNNGTLTIKDNDSLSESGAQTITVDGATLVSDGRTVFGTGDQVILAGGTMSGTGDAHGAYDFAATQTVQVSGESTINGPVRLRNGVTVSMDVAEGGELTFGGTSYSSAGCNGVLKVTGKGETLLTGGFAHTGGTTVEGVLSLADGANFGGTTVTVAAGGTLTLGAATTPLSMTAATLQLKNNAILRMAALSADTTPLTLKEIKLDADAGSVYIDTNGLEIVAGTYNIIGGAGLDANKFELYGANAGKYVATYALNGDVLQMTLAVNDKALFWTGATDDNVWDGTATNTPWDKLDGTDAAFADTAVVNFTPDTPEGERTVTIVGTVAPADAYVAGTGWEWTGDGNINCTGTLAVGDGTAETELTISTTGTKTFTGGVTLNEGGTLVVENLDGWTGKVSGAGTLELNVGKTVNYGTIGNMVVQGADALNTLSVAAGTVTELTGSGQMATIAAIDTIIINDGAQFANRLTGQTIGSGQKLYLAGAGAAEYSGVTYHAALSFGIDCNNNAQMIMAHDVILTDDATVYVFEASGRNGVLGGTITSNGNTFTKTGGGLLAICNAFTDTFSIAVNEGTLLFDGSAVTGTGSATIASGATLQIKGRTGKMITLTEATMATGAVLDLWDYQNQTIGTLNMAGGSTLISGGSNNTNASAMEVDKLVVTGADTESAVIRIDVPNTANKTITIHSLEGSGTLELTRDNESRGNTQNVVLDGAGSFSGNVHVAMFNRLVVAHEDALANATVELEYRNATYADREASLHLAAETIKLKGLKGNTGDVTMASPTERYELQFNTAGGDYSYGGGFDVYSTVNLVKNGAGTQSFTNADIAFSGNITVNEGTLNITKAQSSDGREISIAAGATLGTALTLNGGSLTLDATGTTAASLGGNALTLGQGTTLALTVAGTEVTGTQLTLLGGISELLGATVGEGGLLGTLGEFFTLGAITDKSLTADTPAVADATGADSAWADRLGRSELFYDETSDALYLKLAANILAADPLYWDPTADDGNGNWLGANWSEEGKLGVDPGTMQNPWQGDKPVSVVFDGDVIDGDADVTIDTDAVVTDMTVRDGVFTFVKDGDTGSLTIEGELEVTDTAAADVTAMGTVQAGSLNVGGELDAGVLLVDGDAAVKGILDAANITAGGDITADGGVISATNTIGAVGLTASNGAEVKAEGGIAADSIAISGDATTVTTSTLTVGGMDEATEDALTMIGGTLNAGLLQGDGTAEISGGKVTIGSSTLSSTTVTGAEFVGNSTLAGDADSTVALGDVTVADAAALTVSNATLTDQIDVATGGTLTIGGEMHLDLTNCDFGLENKSTYAETTDAADLGKEIADGGNGFVSRNEVYTVVTGDLSKVDPTDSTWTVGTDAREGVYDKTTGKVTISESKDTTTYWVNTGAVEVSKAAANFADDTTTIKLNGGMLKIDKDTDKAIVTNNENANKTDSLIALLNGSTLEMEQLTIADGTTVTLSGSADSALELGDGYKVDSTKLKGLDKDAWLGTVKTGAINGGLTPVDISGLGNANSSVEADSISGVALTAGTVGTVDVLGDVSLTNGDSTVNTMEVGGKVSLGATAESSLKADTLTVNGAEGIDLQNGSDITADTLTVANGGMTLSEGSEVEAGTLTVGAGISMAKGTAVQADELVTGGLSLDEGSSVNADTLTVNGSIEYKSLAADAPITVGDLTNDALDLTIDTALLKEAVDAGQDVTLISVTNGSDAEISLNGGSNILKNYGEKYSYTVDWDDAGVNVTLDAVANENYMKEKFSGASANGMAGATLMDEAFANGGIGDSGNLKDIMDAVDAENSGMTDEHMAAIAGSSTAALGMAFAGDVERQLRAIRNRTTTMGVNQCVVNEGMPYFNAWVNAEGNMGELDKDGTYAGYKLDSWGGTVGFDVDVNPNLTLGLAVTAMYGDLTVDGPDMLDGDMDTYYVTAFARYSKRAWTHTFIGTVGKMDGSYERTVNHAGGSYTAEGDTDGLAFGLMYEVGRVYALTEDGNTCLQPVFNVAYRHTTVNGYTEKGGNAALDVDDQTLDTITLGAGARMQAVVGENLYNRTSVLELRALAKLDVGDRASEADVAFIGGGSRATVESAELGAFGVELGAGLSIPVGDENDGTIFFDVSAELRSGYSNVNGTVGYRINF